jgi:hypothetical protein
MNRLSAVVVSLSLFIVSVIPQTRSDNTRTEAPPDFVGDGCTFFPDGDYADCCLAHDHDYYYGGTKAERKASDKRLRQCVRNKGHKYISRLMYLGVRIGGGAWLKAPFSWGFGLRKERNNIKQARSEVPTSQP